MRRALAAALLAAASVWGAPRASAQDDVTRADSLLRAGRVFAAESLYYRAVRLAPRQPAARRALGRYLVARGATKVGAVLLEEAIYFGGDARTVAAELAPAYAALGEWRKLASLAGAPLTGAERQRAEWLVANAPTRSGPDSVVVRYAPAAGPRLGVVTLVIGRDSVAAAIDPEAHGLVLDTAWLRRPDVRRFGTARERVVVVPAVRVGGLTLTNVPARAESQGGALRARVGLDLLATLAPTFEPGAGRLVLRRAGRAAASPDRAGLTRLPTLTLPSGLFVYDGTTVTAVASERGRELLGARRWTLDARRGEILVER